MFDRRRRCQRRRREFVTLSAVRVPHLSLSLGNCCSYHFPENLCPPPTCRPLTNLGPLSTCARSKKLETAKTMAPHYLTLLFFFAMSIFLFASPSASFSASSTSKEERPAAAKGVEEEHLLPNNNKENVAEEEDEGIPSNGKIWVLLVAGSKGYCNYRHQADVCHAYQVN